MVLASIRFEYEYFIGLIRVPFPEHYPPMDKLYITFCDLDEL